MKVYVLVHDLGYDGKDVAGVRLDVGQGMLLMQKVATNPDRSYPYTAKPGDHPGGTHYEDRWGNQYYLEEWDTEG